MHVIILLCCVAGWNTATTSHIAYYGAIWYLSNNRVCWLPWASLYIMGWLNGIVVDCQKPLCTKWGGLWQLFWMYDFVGIVLHDVVSMFHEVHFAVVLAFASMHLC